MIPSRLQMFLEQHKTQFDTMSHPAAFTAQEIAQAAHIKGKSLAKVVILKVDGELVMAVVPACCQLNMTKLQDEMHAETLELATEADFCDEFPECETGAMPAMGNLYGMETIIDEQLTEDHDIAFNAGSHTELIRLTYDEYQKLVHPKVGDIANRKV